MESPGKALLTHCRMRRHDDDDDDDDDRQETIRDWLRVIRDIHISRPRLDRSSVV